MRRSFMTFAAKITNQFMTQPPSTSSKLVILGMSGGVDSSVAAHLLLEQGYQVEGLFMKNWEEDDGTEYCTALDDLAEATAVCALLGIKLHTANFAAEYWDNVFEDFLSEYRAGRTPNPDVLCNREIKFKQFVSYAEHLGGDYIATGHYVRSRVVEGQFELCKGLDDNKDQTYFLQAVPRHQLEKCLFPVGEWQKSAVRQLADDLGFRNHDRKDSTGICFIGERRFSDFLDRYIAKQSGAIVDENGLAIGDHMGVHHYTLGQRQGINIGGIKGRLEAPWYVMNKHVETNILVATQNTALLNGGWLRANEVNWLKPVSLPLNCCAKIRYRQSDQSCLVTEAADGQILVQFDEPQRAISPGQYIAFYQGEVMIGGARITIAETSQH